MAGLVVSGGKSGSARASCSYNNSLDAGIPHEMVITDKKTNNLKKCFTIRSKELECLVCVKILFYKFG
jgi:hypothetical protein